MRSLVIVMAIALAACMAATNPSTRTAGKGSGSGLICREETPTGTSMSREVCRTPEQIGDDRKGADDMLRTQGSRPGSGQ